MRTSRYWVGVMLIFIFPVYAFGQNSLSGTIRARKDNQPIIGAEIYIEDLKTGTTSDQHGNYKIINIPDGIYLVSIHSIGFVNLKKLISIRGETTINFILKRGNYQVPEVVVTGNTIASSLQQTAQPILQISNRFLVQNSSTNIIEAISKLPGVSAITDGQSIAKPVIRGLGYNRVITLSDGISQQGQQWGDEFGIEVDPFSVYQVEILKGPGSLRYGSDAIAGVINLISPKSPPPGVIKGNILNEFQSNNGLIGTMAHLKGNIHGISFSTRIDNTLAHAYRNKFDGYVLNSQFSNFNWDAAIGIHRKWGYSQLRITHFNLQTGIVDGTRDSLTGAFERQVGADFNGNPIYAKATIQDLKSYTPQLINQDITHHKVVWQNEFSLGKNRLNLNLAWQQNIRKENNDPSQQNISNISYLLNTVNYDINYILGNLHQFNLSIGMNGMYQNSQNRGTLLLIPQYHLWDGGVFIIANKKLDQFDLSGGIRYDARSFWGLDDFVDSSGNEVPSSSPDAIHRFVGYHSIIQGLSASFGITDQLPGGLYWKTNLAKGFRAPNIAESGSNGIHDGTVVYEIGNPHLRAEESLELDISPGIQTKDFSGEIDFFLTRFDHFIYPRQLLSFMGGDSLNNSTIGFPDAPVFKYTQNRAISTGGEVNLDLHPDLFPWLDWNTTFSTVDIHLENTPDSDKYLPFTPPPKFNSIFTLTIKKLNKTFQQSYFRFGIFHSFKQNHIYRQSQIYAGLSGFEAKASEEPGASYTLLNIGLGTDLFNSGKKILSIYIAADNLSNLTYMDYMSRFKYYPVNLAHGLDRVGVFNMGINFTLKLILPINLKGS
ncbi:MAG: TonB-dependent receptor [Chitinophagaceae bacterium]